jgi:hypothetical protein
MEPGLPKQSSASNARIGAETGYAAHGAVFQAETAICQNTRALILDLLQMRVLKTGQMRGFTAKNGE